VSFVIDKTSTYWRRDFAFSWDLFTKGPLVKIPAYFYLRFSRILIVEYVNQVLRSELFNYEW